MKKALFLLIAIPSLALARPHCGDVNNDTAITAEDVQMICEYDAQMISCTDTGFNAKDCDVNRDGRCDIGDALLIAQCLNGVRSCDFLCKPFRCSEGAERVPDDPPAVEDLDDLVLEDEGVDVGD